MATGVYEADSLYANAVAVIFWKKIIFYRHALDFLTDEEIHGHLCPRTGTSIRIAADPLAARHPFHPAAGPHYFNEAPDRCLGRQRTFGMLHHQPYSHPSDQTDLGGAWEERADQIGLCYHEGKEGLLRERPRKKLYEFNLMPAVMPQKQLAHPHLYDRLVAAGVQPQYPRPAPPSMKKMWSASIISLGLAALLYYMLGSKSSGN